MTDHDPGIVLQSTLRCHRCDYNLTGAVVGGRCPECGTSVQDSIAVMCRRPQLAPRKCGLATASFFIGLLSLFTTPLGLFALALGVAARLKMKVGTYDPDARSIANFAIALGIFATLRRMVFMFGTA